MTAKKLYQGWKQNGIPSDVALKDIKKVAEHYGIETRQANHGTMFKIPDGVQVPTLQYKYAMVSDHAKSKSGVVHLEGAKDFLKIVDAVVEKQEREKAAKEGSQPAEDLTDIEEKREKDN